MSEFIGPTVYEIAKEIIRKCNGEIARLEGERTAATSRLLDPKWRGVQEAERLATRAEPFQSKQLSD